MVEPRTLLIPDGASSAGHEAVELARMAGIDPDAWQEFVVVHAMTERPDGRWAAFEVGVAVPRQNGKGGIIEVRELAGLYLLGEEMLTHSAHLFDTSLEAFHRLLFLIEGTRELESRVERVSRSHGEEGITLRAPATVSTGPGRLVRRRKQRIRFRTRTKGGGRGFSGDLVILDEAMILPETAIGALMPTMSARPNPQLWYLGSAVDQLVHEHGVVFARLRARAIAGVDPSLAYFEWSAPAERPEDVTPEMATDRDAWAAANPAMGIRIDPEHIAKEQRSMDPRTFAVERLGVGDWPSLDPDAGAVIDPEVWRSLEDGDSVMVDPVWFAVDTTPDRAITSIAAAGVRPDGLVHMEVVDRRAGTGWVVDRVNELRAAHSPAGVVVDAASPAASLAEEMGATLLNSSIMARSCGLLFDLVDQRRLRHLGDPAVLAAVRGARKRDLGDAWAWSRRSSSVDISPLVAGTLAVYQAAGKPNVDPFYVLA